MSLLDFFNPPELKPNEPYRGYEQPAWKLMPNQPEDGSFQIRCYPAAVWATTAQSREDNGAFRKLFNYIQGKNNKEQKISMTVPVTMAMSHKEENYSMSFFTPSSFQSSPPNPTGPDVHIENRKELTVYVRNFTGYAKAPEYRAQAKILYEDVVRHGIDGSKLDPDRFYAVGYDSPLRFFNRRNEVWLVEQNNEKNSK